eukprot:scaffold47923_cov37-Tisochrysis_lutea.AAC.2
MGCTPGGDKMRARAESSTGVSPHVYPRVVRLTAQTVSLDTIEQPKHMRAASAAERDEEDTLKLRER